MPDDTKSVKSKSKYGSRENYLKIIRAKSAARKLEKRGVTKVSPKDVTWKIDKYGRAVSSSRALNKTVAEWHEVTHKGASVRKLTKKQAAQLKAHYDHLPASARPTIKNDRVLLGKGMSVFTSGGKTRIERSGTKQIGDRIFMTEGWEERVREFAREHPNEMIMAKQTHLIDKFRSYQLFDTSNFGVDNLIEYMMQYKNGDAKTGDSVTLLLDSTVKKQIKKNQAAFSNYQKTRDRDRKRQSRSRKKNSMRTGRGK